MYHLPMPIRWAREELELINDEMKRDIPDLEFLIIHTKSLAEILQNASRGNLLDDTAPEDALMISAFIEKQKSK